MENSYFGAFSSWFNRGRRGGGEWKGRRAPFERIYSPVVGIRVFGGRLLGLGGLVGAFGRRLRGFGVSFRLRPLFGGKGIVWG